MSNQQTQGHSPLPIKLATGSPNIECGHKQGCAYQYCDGCDFEKLAMVVLPHRHYAALFNAVNEHNQLIAERDAAIKAVGDMGAKCGRAEAERDEAIQQRDELASILGDLVDLQNGPPLIQHKEAWHETMDKANAALAKLAAQSSCPQSVDDSPGDSAK